MTTYSLSAKKRQKAGKGPSRRLRSNEELPAVVYAKGQETLPITVCPRATSKILLGTMRKNALISLEIEGDKKRNVMIKERQIHKTRRELIHVDFVEVDLKKPVMVSVPVALFGKSESVTMGGKLDHVLQKIRVSCLPTAVPKSVEVDISNLKFGSTHCKDIPLPKDVELKEKPRVVVLTIKKPRGAKDEEAATEEEAK